MRDTNSSNKAELNESAFIALTALEMLSNTDLHNHSDELSALMWFGLIILFYVRQHI